MHKIITVLAILALFGSNGLPPLAVSPVPLQVADVVASSVDLPLSVQSTPNDPLYGQQWYLRKVKIDQAWDRTTGSAITIAIIDTGANITHEELTGRLWINQDEIPNNQRDDDGNGYVDDYHGYNFLTNSSNLADEHGHGTGIASIVAARSNNRRGLAGVNWQAQVMILKALNYIGGGEFNDVAQAIRYAVDNGADVINMSFGSPTGSAVLASAVDYATSNHIPIIAAAGNNSNGQIFYPARYPQVIAVGSIDQADQRSSFTNYGAGLDVVAPGEDIIMADRFPFTYVKGSGSSFAAAQVAGIVSLMLAQRPNLTSQQTQKVLRDTADKIGNGDSNYFGAGRVNAVRAVTYQSSILNGQASISNSSAVADGLDTMTISITVRDEFNQVRANTSIRAAITGTNNIINGQLVGFGRSIELGQTDSAGKIVFRLTSTTAERKSISFLDVTTGAALSSSLAVEFSALLRPIYRMQWVKQSPYLNLWLDARETLWVEVKNIGNVVWVSDSNALSAMGQMRLATDHLKDRPSNFYVPTWLSPNRAADMTPAVVKPGEIGTFTFEIQAQQLGSFREYFGGVIEHITWLNDLGIYWDINVTTSGGIENANDEQAVQVNSNSSAYSAIIQSKTADLVLSPGATAVVSVGLRNVGSALWLGRGLGTQRSGEVRLGTATPQDRISKIYLPNWLSYNRVSPAGFNIPPNSNLTLTFTVKAPDQPGVYQENFRLVAEYITWFGPVFGWTITVI